MAQEIELKVIIDAENKTTAVMNQVEKNMASLKDKVASLKPAFQTMAIAGGVAFGAIAGEIVASVKAASEADLQMAKFNATMATMGKEGAKAKDALLQMAQASIKLGFDDEDSANSLAKLYQRTGDVTQAQKLNVLAMDLARAKNIDLTSATNLVGLALSGQGRALMQYGIAIKDSATPLEALGILQEKVGGQAEAASKTFAIQSEALQIQITNVQEAIGTALIPVLQDLLAKMLPVVEKVMDWVTKNPELTKNIIIVAAAVAGFVAVVGTIGLVLPSVIAGIGVLGTALMFLAANPIVLVIVAVAALVAGIVYLAANWKTLMSGITMLTKYWADGIKGIIGGVVDWIQDKFAWLTGTMEKIKGFASTVGNAFGAVGAKISGTTSNIFTGAKNMLGFADGGIVPGPLGAPMIAMVHGGERVLTADEANSRGQTVVFNFNGAVAGDDGIRQIILKTISQLNRDTTLRTVGGK